MKDLYYIFTPAPYPLQRPLRDQHQEQLWKTPVPWLVGGVHLKQALEVQGKSAEHARSSHSCSISRWLATAADQHITLLYALTDHR